MLHLFPHWNLRGHEGEEIDLWVYSNMDEVELLVNGKSLGRKPMERNGYLSWKTVYKPGRVEARGYKDGKRVMVRKIETTGEAVRAEVDYVVPDADSDVQIINVSLVDSKGRFVPDACNPVTIVYGRQADGVGSDAGNDGERDCGIRLLGAGNGDPAFRGVERPTPGPTPAHSPSPPSTATHSLSSPTPTPAPSQSGCDSRPSTDSLAPSTVA